MATNSSDMKRERVLDAEEPTKGNATKNLSVIKCRIYAEIDKALNTYSSAYYWPRFRSLCASILEHFRKLDSTSTTADNIKINDVKELVDILDSKAIQDVFEFK